MIGTNRSVFWLISKYKV